MLSDFVPLRLTQARTARGLTKSNLAALANVSATSISYYESGMHTPKPGILERIAEALKIPTDYFYQAELPADGHLLFFRALRRQKKQLQDQWTVYAEWIESILKYYLQFLDFPPLNIPDFSFGKNWENVSPEMIEDAARKTREYMGLGNGPIPNLVRLVENFGVPVIRIDMDDSEDAFSCWLLDKSLPIAVLSTEVSSCRDRMSLAHELGHLVLHRHITPTESNLKILEKQAKLYASTFLAPDNGYAQDLKRVNLDAFLGLKKKWGVSVAAQIMRCFQLDIINEQYRTYFMTQLSRKGWRKEEPYDDSIPLEQPNLLKESTKLILNQVGISKDDIIASCALYPEDIARCIGLPLEFFTPESSILPMEDARPNPKVIPFSKFHGKSR